MTAVTIDDSLVHYEALGRGRPVIVLHTWLGSWRYWIPCMQQLSVRYRLYALDLWGFGDTGRNAPRYDFDSQVALVHAFMDKLGIGRAALVGHGFGAAVCARVALQHPDRVPRLMAVAPPVFRMPATPPVDPVPVVVVEKVESAPAGIAAPPAPPVQTSATAPSAAPPSVVQSAPAAVVPAPPPTTEPPAPAPAEDTPAAPDAPSSAESPLPAAAVREQIQVMLEEQARRLGEQRMEAAKPAPPRATPPAAPEPIVPLPAANPLRAHWATVDRDELLRRHVSPGADQDKLAVEAGKADPAALTQSVEAFAAVDTLRDLLALAMPAVAVYGREDTLLPTPDSALFANGSGTSFHTLALDATRHFPMLEHPTLFARLLIDFLESPDVRTLGVKETWERRVR